MLHLLNLLFYSSVRTENEDLIVHFNIHIDPAYINIQAKDLEAILSNEISVEESLFFRNLTIDTKSLEVQPSDVLPQVTSPIPPTTTISQIITQAPLPPRKCYPLQLEYCQKLQYNLTTYPNILNHKTLKDVSEDVITFRELVSLIDLF